MVHWSSGLLHWEEERFRQNLTVGLKIGLVHWGSWWIRNISNIWKAHGVVLVKWCFGRRFFRRRWWGWWCSSSSWSKRCNWKVVLGLLGLVFWVLEVAELVLASWFSVLEPVKDIGITYLTILLQLSPDLSYLIPWRVHHARVENCFKYPNLLRFWIPSWFWLRTAFFTSRNCWGKCTHTNAQINTFLGALEKPIRSISLSSLGVV